MWSKSRLGYFNTLIFFYFDGKFVAGVKKLSSKNAIHINFCNQHLKYSKSDKFAQKEIDNNL